MVCARFDQSGMAFKRSLTSLAVKTGIIPKSILVSPGPALSAATGEFIHGGPSPRFRGFRADTLFLVAGFDVFRLTFLFVSITGFITLRHRCSSATGNENIFDDLFDRFTGFPGSLLNPTE